MHPVTIPIRALPIEPEEGVEFMAMPREMSTFEMPRVPEPGLERDVAAARDVLLAFMASCDRWLAKGCPADEPPALDLAGLPAATLQVLNETLGEGEVSALSGDGQSLRIQETVFSGLWREQHFAHGGVLRHDFLIAAPVPPVLHQLALVSASPRLRELPLPRGAMNVPALVNELQEAVQRCEAGTPSHVINLTLLPLSAEDAAHLDALLEGGGVVLLSRGFGNCRISSTALSHTWRVQYFNNMQTLILNTIEVVDFPEVALAADEDLRESRDRLAELVQWMDDSLAEA
jgi:hydrogenase-1 operon protein HyaF